MKFTITTIGKVFPPKGKQTFETLGFMVAEYPDRWITIPHDNRTQGWKQGDVIDIIIDEVEFNGKKYLNGKFVSEKAVLQQTVKEIEPRVKALEDKVEKLIEYIKTLPSTPTDLPWEK